MRHGAICITILLSFAFIISSYTQQDEFPVLKGPYLGQKPPGMTPELFAPGIVSSGMNEASLVFAPDYNEIYYDLTHLTHRFTAIVCMRRENGFWRQQEVAPFSGKFMDASPFITGDNQKLFYCSNKPFKKDHDLQDFDLWHVQRSDKGWGDPINLGLPVNSGEPINTSDFESSPYVSPDASYIIFNVFVGRNSDRKSGLHVSFKTNDGSWSNPVYMGDAINAGGPSMFARVSPDGKYLFFTSENVPYLPFGGDALNYGHLQKMLTGPQNGTGDIYWVDAKIIEGLKPTGLRQGRTLQRGK